MYSKVLEEVEDNNSDLNILVIEGEKHTDFLDENDIIELPTTLIYSDKEIKERIDDFVETDELEEVINNYL